MSTALQEAPVVVATNIPQVANVINTSIHSSNNKVVKAGNKKGRPPVHSFAGRITFLRDEVEFALQNGDAFIEMMRKEHALDEQRRAILLANGILTETEEMFYTFKGSIERVLEEMSQVINRWEATASIRCDFHKVKTFTNPKKDAEHYIAPVVKQDAEGNTIVTKIEAIPDQIYGYVRVIFNK